MTIHLFSAIPLAGQLDARGGAMPVEQDTDRAGISLAREIRGQIFVWVGIVGGALTIVNHWSNFLSLADWTRWLANNWGSLTHEFWSFIGNSLGIHISRSASYVLSFMSFYISLSFGAVVLSGRRRLRFAMDFEILNNKDAIAVLMFIFPAVLFYFIKILRRDYSYAPHGDLEIVLLCLTTVGIVALLLEGTWYERLLGSLLYLTLTTLNLRYLLTPIESAFADAAKGSLHEDRLTLTIMISQFLGAVDGLSQVERIWIPKSVFQ